MDHELLKSIGAFSTLGDDHLRSLAALMSEAAVPQGAAIVKQGECTYDLFAILEGRADVLRDGKRVATLDPGECFGEVGALERRPRTATVVALNAAVGGPSSRMSLDVAAPSAAGDPACTCPDPGRSGPAHTPVSGGPSHRGPGCNRWSDIKQR